MLFQWLPTSNQNLHYINVNALIVHTSRRPAETSSGKGYSCWFCEDLCSPKLVPQVTARRVQECFGAPWGWNGNIVVQAKPNTVQTSTHTEKTEISGV